MVGAHILDGDYVLVQPQQSARDGEIVVALIGDEATVKRFYKTPKGVTLKAENPKFKDHSSLNRRRGCPRISDCRIRGWRHAANEEMTRGEKR